MMTSAGKDINYVLCLCGKLSGVWWWHPRPFRHPPCCLAVDEADTFFFFGHIFTPKKLFLGSNWSILRVSLPVVCLFLAAPVLKRRVHNGAIEQLEFKSHWRLTPPANWPVGPLVGSCAPGGHKSQWRSQNNLHKRNWRDEDFLLRIMPPHSEKLSAILFWTFLLKYFLHFFFSKMSILKKKKQFKKKKKTYSKFCDNFLLILLSPYRSVKIENVHPFILPQKRLFVETRTFFCLICVI